MTDWLFDTLMASTALLLLVLLVRGSIARHFGASVAYWLWILPAARLFMPVLTEEIAVPAVPAANAFVESIRAAPTTYGQIATTEASFNWLALGLAIWLGGAALLLIVQMVRYCSLRDEMLADATEIDRIGDIRVIQSDRIGGP